MTDKNKNILIIKPSALGDIVLALPAVCSLAESFSGAKISWFVRPEYAPLLKNHPCVHEIIYFDRKNLGKWWYNPKAFKKLCLLIKRLRDGRFDIAFDFQGLFRSALFGFFSGAARRFGMADAREFAHVFYTDTIPQNEKSVHLVDYFLQIASAAGADVGEVKFKLSPSDSALKQVDELLERHKVDKKNYVVLVPGSTVETKCWPARSFAALADKISLKFGSTIIATGVAAEKENVELLKKEAKIQIVDLLGVTDIPQLVALLSKARMVISNDTGPAHIASALGVAMVLIFGHTNPGRVGPYGRSEAVAAVEAGSRGTAVQSREPQHKIANVSVDEVFEKVCEQFEKHVNEK
ncbi:MAG: hypothetical protein GWO86_01490 [Planctomycetes bacterium]|nr:hypothetical protein [Planctomycetota bacterium]